MEKLFKILLLFGLTMFFACTEELDVTFNTSETKRVAVDGLFTTDTTAHTVKLEWTTNYFSSDPLNKVTGATVTISDGQDIIFLSETEPGIYQTDSNVYGVPGNTYTLNVELTDGEAYTASDEMNAVPGIDSITITENKLFNDWDNFIFGHGYLISHHGPDYKGVNNFYEWNLYIDGVLDNDTIGEAWPLDASFIDGSYMSLPLFFLNQERMLEDSVYDITLEFQSISKEYYEFYFATMMEQFRGTPWDAPPADLPTNVSNKGVGYFKTVAIKRKKGILFSDQTVHPDPYDKDEWN